MTVAGLQHPHTPMPEEHPVAASPVLDMSRCFATALAAYRQNFWPLVCLSCGSILLSVFTLSLLVGPLCGGWIVMCIDLLSRPGRDARTELVFSQGHRFSTLALLAFLTTVGQLAALATLVLPGLLLVTLWVYSYPLVVDQRMPAGVALDRSARLVCRRDLLSHLILGSLVLTLNIIPAIVPVVGWMIGCFTMPLGWLLIAAAYLQAVHEHPSSIREVLPPGFDVRYASAATREGEGA